MVDTIQTAGVGAVVMTMVYAFFVLQGLWFFIYGFVIQSVMLGAIGSLMMAGNTVFLIAEIGKWSL